MLGESELKMRVRQDEETPGADWLPVGEEPQPATSITDCVILRNEGISLVSFPNGEIDAADHEATGIYTRDTRHLSRLRLSIGGVRPTLLDASESGPIHSAVFTNPALVRPDGELVPARALVLRRRRVVADGLHEALTVSNYSGVGQRVELRVEFDADFRDIFEVRGFERQSPRPEVRAEVDEAAVTFRYQGLDGEERWTRIRFEPRPAALAPNLAVFDLELASRGTRRVDIRVELGRKVEAAPVEEVVERVRRQQTELLQAVTQLRADYEPLTHALEHALLDVHALRTKFDGEQFVAAGVPWFDTLFGRDSLITGLFLLPFWPDVLRVSLKELARHQAEEFDPIRDASPGKIPHELRWGELARIGEVPFARYYGSVDSTPLFLIAGAEYLAWTGDERTVRALWRSFERAVEWCLRESEGGSRPLAYARMSAAGLENQGWKDSHDAIVWPDGRLALPPIALVEAQAYLWAALAAFADLARALGEEDRGAGAAADRVRSWFEERFAHRELGYVLCLEEAARPVPTAASNVGHVLWVGAASEEMAARAARRLFQPDLFSGWGIRTLSADAARYNPLGYHTGSVWPHDNAIALAGLRRYGFDDLASRLASALIDAALAFPSYRIPELFSGDPRELRLVPTPFPVASRPQAWAAASLPYVMATLLGLRPRGPRELAIVRPILPPGVEWVRVRNLRFHGAAIDLTFRRGDARVAVEVDDVRGQIDIVLSDSWPSSPLARHG